jgi:hypothetical protein
VKEKRWVRQLASGDDSVFDALGSLEALFESVQRQTDPVA